jgi:hypothetical protein
VQGPIDNSISALFAYRYEETRQKLTEVNDHRDLEILREAHVVGLTTSGLADKQSLIVALAPKARHRLQDNGFAPMADDGFGGVNTMRKQIDALHWRYVYMVAIYTALGE